MEKPRKKRCLHPSLCGPNGDCQNCSFNDGLDAMTAWIDGELPTVEELEKVIEKNKWIISARAMRGEPSINSGKEIAKSIHSLLTRKLKGEG